MKVRPRIAVLAATAALACSAAAVSAPAAHAATEHVIANDQQGAPYITSHGLNKEVTLTVSGTGYYAIDGTTVNGDRVYQYEAVGTDLCLQDDINGTGVVIEGDCVDGNARQQWNWDSTTGFLQNMYAIENRIPDKFAAKSSNGTVGMYYDCATGDLVCEWDIL